RQGLSTAFSQPEPTAGRKVRPLRGFPATIIARIFEKGPILQSVVSRSSWEAKMIQRTVRWALIGITTCVAAGLFTAGLHAQTVGASLQGIVTDTTGATVPNATIIVIGVATGGTWEVKSDSDGHYRLPLLQPGEYEVHVSQTGFQPLARRGIQLTVGQAAVVDVKLEIGRLSEEL